MKIERKLVSAFGKWNYDYRDNTFWIIRNGQRMKLTLFMAEEMGIIIREYDEFGKILNITPPPGGNDD